ncbi:huntingtin-interacting protein 1-related protein [Pseudonaja textilis]|uniref:huntingtin-interacting protein 1-related protein n=1 Tax=Pseudonaja textilis TaxID=8673 RepID=UPI000EAA85F4|nr:huntingtin-interacting protein 1-related protein [Pseudonaja textilis]
MNTIKNVPARVLSRRVGHSLEAEREQFDKNQAISISKAINTLEVPVKEKHARRIILGTHHEKGAFTFWSYAIGLPLPSSAILSWKFCHVLHKVLRDGHPNVLQDCQRYRSNIRETGDLWGHLHDRYGQLVNIYTKLLLIKISFHVKHPQFPPGLEVTDEVLEKAAGTDVNNIFQLTVEMFDYMDCELKLAESVFRQLNTSMAISQMSAVQCRLAPLIQVIQDCSHLYHYTVKLMFNLHSCLPADTLQGHRDRFHEQFRSLKNFFKRASDMLYFKRLIQIPRLPEVSSVFPSPRILNSCTDLMKAIRQLVLTSTHLQKEIVEGGRGAATPQEFYAKNSCWTEGLISASKAVGWGATQLVESADKVVLHTGKYEELIVCSHEIAASTAQLVAASKVKAEKHSKNLGKLQECSRRVNEKAANVVASTKSGQEQVEEKDTMDFSGLSLIKLKKEEMETQVKVLELEKTLENERLRLGELRRQHYALAGLYTENTDGKKPTIARKPASLQRPAMAQKPGQSKPDSELAQDGVYQAHVVNF